MKPPREYVWAVCCGSHVLRLYLDCEDALDFVEREDVLDAMRLLSPTQALTIVKFFVF